MVQRDIFLEQLIKLKNTSPIKVISGIRRCGKSTLLDLFEEHLLKEGTAPESIIHINFELDEFDSIRGYKDLSAFVESRLSKGKKSFVLLDEVQQVSGWEKAVNSLRAGGKADLYLTGSNSFMLSSELATLLSGRYLEIKMLPLSFKEYRDFNPAMDIQDQFTTYMEYGGFPGLHEMRNDENLIRSYLSGVYNTILVKDVMTHYSLRDTELLEKVVRFMAGNIGNLISAKKISDFLTSSGRKTSHETIDTYLRMLESAYFLYKAPRYDLKGKELLKTQGKYYIADTGLRFWSLGRKGIDMGSILENLVFLELLRRGCQVFVGSLPKGLEVDFIAQKDGIKTYYQVCQTLQLPEVLERELKPLRAIDDNYGKIILSLDRTPFNDLEGIRCQNIIDFLLEKDFTM
jgi:predicted AAA+ superfamily ATPase